MPTLDISTPIGWKVRHLWVHKMGRYSAVVFAFCPTHFAVGFEFLVMESKGLAVMLGPFWIGFATLPAKQEPTA